MLTFKSALDELYTDAAPVDDTNSDKRVPKASVGYTNESQVDDESCAICSMYLAGRCDAVFPPEVSSRGWCELFEPEKRWLHAPITRAEKVLECVDDPILIALLNNPLVKELIDNAIFDRSHPVPYGAGGSVPISDPTVFIDSSVPKTLIASGVEYDPAAPWAVHENSEQFVMEILDEMGVSDDTAYKFAHFCVAEVLEAAWYRYHGIDPDEAEAVEKPILDAIQSEKITDENANPRLYLKPYPHDNEKAAAGEWYGEAQPTPAEIAECRHLLEVKFGEGPIGEELPSMISTRQTIEKAVRQYLSQHAPEIAVLIAKDMTANDAHVATALGNESRSGLNPKKPRPLKPRGVDPRKAMSAKSFDDLISVAYFQGQSHKRFQLRVAKADEDKQQIFGWASVSTIDGQRVIDKQDDVIPIEELEAGAYEFVQFHRDMGDMHLRLGTGRMIESVVCTKQKAACGLSATVDGKPVEAWWVGFQIVDPESWRAFKAGERPELSIGGRATWEEAEPLQDMGGKAWEDAYKKWRAKGSEEEA
jgi:hypothetical protein